MVSKELFHISIQRVDEQRQGVDAAGLEGREDAFPVRHQRGWLSGDPERPGPASKPAWHPTLRSGSDGKHVRSAMKT